MLHKNCLSEWISAIGISAVSVEIYYSEISCIYTMCLDHISPHSFPPTHPKPPPPASQLNIPLTNNQQPPHPMSAIQMCTSMALVAGGMDSVSYSHLLSKTKPPSQSSPATQWWLALLLLLKATRANLWRKGLLVCRFVFVLYFQVTGHH